MTALDRALKLLARKARTAAEMDRALERQGVGKEERHAAVARLRELGYMDDAAVAQGRARTLVEQGFAPRLAAARLLAQGVEGALARGAAVEAAGGATERELVRRALERRLRGRQPRDQAERRRLFRALAAKGHRPALVAEALRIEWDGDDDAMDQDR